MDAVGICAGEDYCFLKKEKGYDDDDIVLHSQTWNSRQEERAQVQTRVRDLHNRSTSPKRRRRISCAVGESSGGITKARRDWGEQVCTL